ncbi:Holliday junction branch migration protein RuvA [Amaricoccus solimangrovi]|uniref:Holliday junction branch migration complex subunit RuvA n=1 Tax=Amaricoccus solimangrovi TaxID=2589815 RepID=A0A501WYD8_9RHOB|nr:Holliday junction branch migration protein RuvA [Amaricoccus solimangrovi]TPE53782.1 Holliday junction branch migration protein RuvA [Amaricoccus solimangrovi]
MIGKVTGRLDHRAADHVLIETQGGVGYLVHCSDRTLMAMPGPGGFVSLYTDLLVREDLLQLVGFLTLGEREWYRLLVSVQGVGAKAALAILGALGTEGLARALSLGDSAAFRAAPGIGPKIAQRLVLELKAKAPAIMALGAAGARPAMTGEVIEAAPAEVPRRARPAPPPEPPAAAVAQADALSALSNLGYAPGEAAAAVTEAIGAEPGLDTAGLIRAALRLLAPKG